MREQTLPLNSSSSHALRLGVNIDHVATLRNARGGAHPCPVKAAHMAIAAGADSITAHLREDRRHIRDADIEALRKEISKPLNFEMAVTEEMLKIACRIKPHAACLVPEKREERTTEGGLAVIGFEKSLKPAIARLKDASIRVSLFIAPDFPTLEASKKLGAPVVELHTGTWCEALAHGDSAAAHAEYTRLVRAAEYGTSLGLEVHAGHGLTYESAKQLATMPEFYEFNIGHFLMGEALFEGLPIVIQKMRHAMQQGRNSSMHMPSNYPTHA